MSRNLAALVGALLLGALLVGAGMAVADARPAAQSGATDDPTDAQHRTIDVAASGTAETQPDKAVVRLSVVATADDPRTARERVAENVSAMTDALADRGIEDDQIRTVDYDLRERRHPRTPEKRDADPAYRARHGLVVEVDDVDATGGVIDAAVDNGAANVHDVRFTLSEATERELRAQALQEAMENARAQADTAAAAADLAVTGVHAVSTGEVRRPRRPVAHEAAGDAGGTDIRSGPVTVTVSVEVTYDATES